MERFLFVYSWLSSLTEGRFFRTGFSSLLRLSAIALTIYLIGDAIETWQKLLSADNQSAGILLPVIVQIILFVAGYMMVHLMLLRAAEIRSLYDPRYALSEIVTVLARLTGELLFVITLTVTMITALQTMGLQTGILLPELHKVLAPLLEQSSLAWIIGTGALLGFMLLVAGYLASEILEMVMKMSRNSERRL
ncbi:MAG: hypothetical protein H8D24_04165 [Gammaproteobacteria bacterium]|uniref:Uncharacterized protein n=1 Tax=Candidatus Thiopontia autotrophica TaxID=2841688 RepID=A0A8J6TXE6_9GAMM|nr:hypothetical protein [Candidatus Thiopontia autotrophica]MBL6969709.1 hypothetical protein [Gammaproteobacteria bacterium]